MAKEALLEYINDNPDSSEQILQTVLTSPTLSVFYLENDQVVPEPAPPAFVEALKRQMQACREHKCSPFDGFSSTHTAGRYKHSVFVNLEAVPEVGFYNKPPAPAWGWWVGLGLGSIALGYLYTTLTKKKRR